MSTNKKFAHEMVAQIAKEMAGCWYEEAAHDNDFYKYYSSQAKFIKREWPRFLTMAKEQLAIMLGNSMTPEWQKEQIFDALLKHATLPGNVDKRIAAKIVNAPSSRGVH